MKIVLAGSPSIAVDAFRKVIENFDVVAIVTQPDRKQGRGLKLQQTPVSELAQEFGIKVFKPSKIIEIKDELEKLEYDQFLTFAFGQWIPESVLKQGKNLPLNIHGSLLPKYRGAAPIHHAILNGEEEIGITLMEMIKKMDAGQMFFKASTSIDETTTVGQGFEIVSKLAADNIVAWLKLVEEGKAKGEEQSSNFTEAPKILKTFGLIDNNLTVKEALRKIMGLNPFPGAFTFINEKRVKIFNASIEHEANSIKIDLKDGSLFITDYQFESKKRVTI